MLRSRDAFEVRAVGEIGQLFRIFGWEPVLLGLAIFALLFISLVVILVYAAGKYKIPIETKFTPLFNLRLGNPHSPNFSPKTAIALSSKSDVSPIGRALRDFRKRRKIRQAEVAKLLDVPASFISAVEGGKEELSNEQLERIISQFGVQEREATKLREALEFRVVTKR